MGYLHLTVYDSFFGTLVLALHCFCRDNVKYGLLSKHLSMKATIWRLKKSQSNDKLL